MIRRIKNDFFLWRNGLMEASRIQTHMTAKEKRILYRLARKSSGSHVEIGSYLGASSCFIAAAIRRNSTAQLYCVDTWQNDAMTEGRRDTYAEFVENTQNYSASIVAVRRSSADAAQGFDRPVGFLFFDGDHSYEGINRDWQAWYPLLAPQATVVFHDIGWAEGVQRVVDDCVRPIAISSGSLPNMFWARIQKSRELGSHN